MNSYPCPEWLRCRQITDSEYRRWLERQTISIWKREKKHGKTAYEKREDLKQALHRVAHASDGHDPYTGIRFNVNPMKAGWVDPHAGIKGGRHFCTTHGDVPSFDHVKGLGRRSYKLCTRATNAAKSFMSPAQFMQLCRRVVSHCYGKGKAAA